MERKLAEYRAKKAKESKNKISEVKMKTRFFGNLWATPNKEGPEEEALVPPDDRTEPIEDIISVCSNDEETVDCWTWTDFMYYSLWFILWVILYWIFIELQFGTVFLILSGIVFMFVNTRTRPKGRNEVSAYSVFNKNCVSIDGTLKAEQFEREIRYGHGAVK